MSKLPSGFSLKAREIYIVVQLFQNDANSAEGIV